MVNTNSRNIIITGGAHGIGGAPTRYAQYQSQSPKHRVFIIDLDADELEYAATRHLSAYAPRVGCATADLQSQQEIHEAVAKAAKFFDGRINVFVNAAGNIILLN